MSETNDERIARLVADFKARGGRVSFVAPAVAAGSVGGLSGYLTPEDYTAAYQAAKAIVSKPKNKPKPHQRPIYGTRGSWRRKRSEPVT